MPLATRVLHCGAERRLNDDLSEAVTPRRGIGVCWRETIGATLLLQSVTFRYDCQADTKRSALAV
jgi:hypothetical protein